MSKNIRLAIPAAERTGHYAGGIGVFLLAKETAPSFLFSCPFIPAAEPTGHSGRTSKENAELFRRWGKSVPPPEDQPTKWNRTVNFVVPVPVDEMGNWTNLPMTGQVKWDPDTGSYFFHPECLSESNTVVGYRPCVITLPSLVYRHVCAGIRKVFRISDIRGLYDEEEAAACQPHKSKTLH